jgi:hypothetical protein
MTDIAHHLPVLAILPFILYVGSGVKSDVAEQSYLKEEIYVHMYWHQT